MSAQEIRQGRDGKNYSASELINELRIMEKLDCLNAKDKGVLRAAEGKLGLYAQIVKQLETMKARLEKLDRIERDEAEKVERRRALIEQSRATAAALDDYDNHKFSGLLAED
ncbi:MAG: hypothetical protein IKN04_20470 [Clostridia bacterium]|nr:hypothetical protein [Clostridia bacterium]